MFHFTYHLHAPGEIWASSSYYSPLYAEMKWFTVNFKSYKLLQTIYVTSVWMHHDSNTLSAQSLTLMGHPLQGFLKVCKRYRIVTHHYL